MDVINRTINIGQYIAEKQDYYTKACSSLAVQLVKERVN